MNSFLRQIRNFFSDPKKLRMVIIAIAVLAIGGLLVSGYIVYIENRERSLSLIVNEKVNAKNEVIEEWEAEEITGEDYTNQLADLSDELHQLYQENSGTHNGMRALLTSAELDLRLGYSSAEEKLQVIIAEAGSMAPVATYLLAQVYEDRQEYSKALDTLKPFQEEYVIHYLKPLVMLAEARIYRTMDQNDQAAAVYSEILQKQEFSSFFSKAEEGIDLLEWERQQKGEGSEVEDIVPDYQSDLAPDYLQSNN